MCDTKNSLPIGYPVSVNTLSFDGGSVSVYDSSAPSSTIIPNPFGIDDDDEWEEIIIRRRRIPRKDIPKTPNVPVDPYHPTFPPPPTYPTITITEQPCAIDEFFKRNPNAQSVMLVCSCPKHRIIC
jgi:hypothetical protein